MSLTPRHIRIIRQVAAGRCQKQIADELGVAIGTVQYHLDRIYKRTGARGIALLTRYAVRRGLVQA